MTYETYLNLTRVIEKRISQARKTGNHEALSEACAELYKIRRRAGLEMQKGSEG